jgi:hypothetical protein
MTFLVAKASPTKMTSRETTVRAALPASVTRHQHDSRDAGYVQAGSVAECGDFQDRRRPQRPEADGQCQEPQKRQRPDRPQTWGVRIANGLDFSTGQLGVCLMDQDGNVPFTANPFGKAQVVRMSVGQDDRPNVFELSAHRFEFGRQVSRVVAGRARVDDGHFAGLLQEVDVDHPATQTPYAGGDFHRYHPFRWGES